MPSEILNNLFVTQNRHEKNTSFLNPFKYSSLHWKSEIIIVMPKNYLLGVAASSCIYNMQYCSRRRFFTENTKLVSEYIKRDAYLYNLRSYTNY